MKLITILLLCAGLMLAQMPKGCTLSADGKSYTCPVPVPPPVVVPPTPAPVVNVATPYLPSSWMGAGGGWNKASTPQIAGWASYAKLISTKSQTYSFTSWDITSVKGPNFVSQSSARTGLATLIKQVGPVSVLGFGDAGMATSSGLGGAFSGGGIAVIKLGKTNFTIELAVRVLKVASQPNQMVYEFGIGRTSE